MIKYSNQTQLIIEINDIGENLDRHIHDFKQKTWDMTGMKTPEIYRCDCGEEK